MPSLKLGRFNLAKARFRGCFLKVIRKFNKTMPSLRSETFMFASLGNDSNGYSRFALLGPL